MSGIARLAAVLSLLGVSPFAAPGHAAIFNVIHTPDGHDAVPGDSVCETAEHVCTLRAAIEEANALPGADAIELAAIDYKLDLGPRVDVTDHLTITGESADGTIIKGRPDFHATFVISAGATVDMSDLTITGARAWGIWNHGTLLLSNATVRKNRAGGLVNTGTAVLTNVTVVKNRASTGGAIRNGGALTLTNVTVANNHSAHDAGGVHSDGGSLAMTNVTMVGNSCHYGCAANLRVTSGSAVIRNTIITGRKKINCDVPGGISAGYNIDNGATCQFLEPSDLSSTNPLLGRLRDNGGATETAALQPGSPAIDSGDNGNCPATDQRGVPRLQGAACDRGAYEAQP